MTLFKKMMVHAGYMDAADEHNAGGGGGDDAAKAAADKAAAENAAAAQKDADAAEAEAARLKAEQDAKGRKPTDEEAKLLKEVMQKKEALQKTADELKKAQDRLKEFDGIDPEAVRKLLKDQKDAETAQLEARGEWDRLKARMAEEHSTQTKSLQDQIAALRSELAAKDSTIDQLSIGQSFGQSSFIADELTLTPAKARVVYGAHFDLVDGQVVGYDKPRGAANRTPLVNASGDPVAFDEALRKIVEADPDKDHLIKSKVKGGSGSDSKPKAPVVKVDVAAKGSIDKINAGLASLNLNAGGKVL